MASSAHSTTTRATASSSAATGTAVPASAARPAAGAGGFLLRRWERMRSWPAGKWLFSRAVGRMAPYTGTIGARVLELEPGHARLAMRDRRGLRNHLRSLHAVALVNLAEEASGLAMLAGLPDDARAILVRLSIDYLKKARGTITAEARCPVPDGSGEQELLLPVELTDQAGEVVARAEARWKVGPKSAPRRAPESSGSRDPAATGARSTRP